MAGPYFDDDQLGDGILSVRPAAPCGPQNVELSLYRGHELIGRSLGMVDIREGSMLIEEIRPVTGSVHNNYRAQLYMKRPGPGPWQSMEAEVIVNGGALWGARKPLVYYSGEPTDWASGIVRWEWPGGAGLRAVDLALTIRRAS